MAKVSVPGGIRIQILRDFEKDRPKFSEWDEWIEAKATIYGVPFEALQQVFAKHAEVLECAIDLQSQSLAQKLAMALGVTRQRAITKLGDLMEAKKVKHLVNRDGEVTGEVETDDFDVQLRASIEVLKIHGSYAPQKIEVKASALDELRELSDEELHRRVEEAKRVVEMALSGDGEYAKALNGAAVSVEVGSEGSTSGAVGPAASDSGSTGAASGSGPVLLADGMHQNPRRARHKKPVQAVSESPVHTPCS